MKNTVLESQFRDSFSCRPDNFSYDGLTALYNYLTDLEEDCGMEVELDPIAFCCEYSEYAGLEEFQANYGDEYETIDDIQDHTPVIMVGSDGFIIQDF